MIMIKKSDDKLTTEERNELSPSTFGLPETREYPMPDSLHVRAAEAYFRYAPEDKKPLLAYRILQKAREFGVNVESPVIHSWAERYEG